jgi:hypothetical protein
MQRTYYKLDDIRYFENKLSLNPQEIKKNQDNITTCQQNIKELETKLQESQADIKVNNEKISAAEARIEIIKKQAKIDEMKDFVQHQLDEIQQSALQVLQITSDLLPIELALEKLRRYLSIKDSQELLTGAVKTLEHQTHHLSHLYPRVSPLEKELESTQIMIARLADEAAPLEKENNNEDKLRARREEVERDKREREIVAWEIQENQRLLNEKAAWDNQEQSRLVRVKDEFETTENKRFIDELQAATEQQARDYEIETRSQSQRQEKELKDELYQYNKELRQLKDAHSNQLTRLENQHEQQIIHQDKKKNQHDHERESRQLNEEALLIGNQAREKQDQQSQVSRHYKEERDLIEQCNRSEHKLTIRQREEEKSRINTQRDEESEFYKQYEIDEKNQKASFAASLNALQEKHQHEIKEEHEKQASALHSLEQNGVPHHGHHGHHNFPHHGHSDLESRATRKALEDMQAAETHVREERHSQELISLDKSHEQQSQAREGKHIQARNALIARHESQARVCDQRNEQQHESLIRKNDESKRELKRRHDQENLGDLSVKHDREKSDLEQRQQKECKENENSYRGMLDVLKASQEREIAELNRQQTVELDSLGVRFTTDGCQKQHVIERQYLDSRHEERKRQQKNDLTGLHERRLQEETERRGSEHSRLLAIEIAKSHNGHAERERSESDRRYRVQELFQANEKMIKDREYPARKDRDDKLFGLNIDLKKLREYESNLILKLNELKTSISHSESVKSAAEKQIDDAQKNLKNLEVAIQDASQQDKITFQNQLNRLTDARQSLLLKKKELEEKITHNQLMIGAQNSAIASEQGVILKLTGMVGEFSSLSDISSINNKILELKNKSHLFNLCIIVSNGMIETDKKSISDSAQIINRCQRELDLIYHDKFFTNLKNNAKELSDNLFARVRTVFTQYDLNHPFDQTPEVRACLADVDRSLELILKTKKTYSEYPPEEQPGFTSVLNNQHVSSYYRLCGFLCRLRQRAVADSQFVVCIESLIDNNFDSLECLKMYKWDNVPEMNAESLVTYDNKNYTQALHELVKFPQAGVNEKLFNHAQDVVKAVEAAKNTPVKDGDPVFDISLNTRILRMTSQLLRTPDDKKLIADYHRIANHHRNGQLSICKKVSGTMLMLFGALLAVAAVAVGILSAGIGSGLAIGGMVTGVAMLTSGYGIFRSGDAKGPAGAMYHVIRQIKPELLDRKNEVVTSLPLSLGLSAAR